MPSSKKEEKDIAAQIQALLFVYGEPMKKKRIAAILEKSEDALEEGLILLEKELAKKQSGVHIVSEDGTIQLVTKPLYGDLIEKIIKEEIQENLTPATLETLAIIAYAGPISRAEIEYIRGVNSSFMLRNLVLRGLVERMPDARRANAYVYRASIDLLKHLGVQRTESLPEYAKFRELVHSLWKHEPS